MPYSTILARFMAFMPIALQICCMFSSIAGTEYYVKTIDVDGLTKLNVSNENVDGSSGDDGNVNCIGNSLNAPNGSITLVMVFMKTIA